jgi:hypothetical protein
MTTATEARNEAIATAKLHPLDVGSVAVSTWGYDQTNVDFYVVLERKVRKDNSTWVKVQRICSVETPTELFMQYHAVPFRSVGGCLIPLEGHKPIWRKLFSGWDGTYEGFSPESYSWARTWTGEPVWGSSYA